MPNSTENQKQCMELLIALMDGGLDDVGRNQLNDLCRSDQSCRHLYLKIMSVHGMLLWRSGASQVGEQPDDDTSTSLLLEVVEQERKARIKREAEAMLEKQQQATRDAERRESMRRLAGLSKAPTGPQTRHYVIPRPIFYGSIAALVAIAALIIWPMFEQADETSTENISVEVEETPIQFVAFLDSFIDAQWANGQVIGAGQSLPQGKYELKSGVVKITYETGAEVIIQGPAEFSLNSPTKVTLGSGKLAGLCPTEQSRGFVVQTPNAQVTDLGTEFGVVLNADGSLETHVFDGEVEVAPVVGGVVEVDRTQRIEKGSARKIDRSGKTMDFIAVQSLAVLRHRELEAIQLADTSPYHRWLAHSYALRRDQSTVAYFTFAQEDQDTGELANRAHATANQFNGMLDDAPVNINVPRWTNEGRFGKPALRFDREEYQRVIVPDWRGVGPFRNLTIAAWINVEQDDGWHLLATQWNDFGQEQDRFAFHFGIRCPSYVADGLEPYKAPGLQLHLAGRNGQMVRDVVSERDEASSTTSEDGWVHVAFVFDSDAGYVDLYRNGVRVQSNKIEGDILHRIPSIDQPLVLGGKVNPEEYVGFHGMMDEFVVIKKALKQSDLKSMYELGKPE